MKIFWLVLSGVVGTAHHNREGKVVDFRPADRSPEVKDFKGRKVMEIRPPRGVPVEPLRLELVHQEFRVTKKDDPHEGMEHGQWLYRSNFCGVEFVDTTQRYWGWYDEQKKAAFYAAQEAEGQARKARAQEELRQQEEFVASLQPSFFVGKLSKGELAQLRGGSLDLADCLRAVINREILEQLGHGRVRVYLPHIFYGVEDMKKLEENRKILLDEETRLREERKQLWLAKAGRGEKDENRD